MKYYANFNVNNGTRLNNDITGTNLKLVKKEITELAKGQIFCTRTNVGNIIITDDKGKEVYYATIFISKDLTPYIRVINK